MPDDALSPEALGDVGEDLFRSLCSQAELVCNKSDRDKTGWDFRVEFPFDGADTVPLDQRAPRVCQLQVKSTAGESGTRVSAKLSAVERLAKDTAPAAMIILRLRRDGSPLAGYVVHLIDSELGKVLRRLRQAAADARRDINRMTISFDYAKASRFELTPAGLKAALAEVCGNDVAAYTERKQFQLASLGYEGGAGLEAEALIWIESKDHLTRVLSGLAPIQPIRLQAYDRRFNIRLPYEGAWLDGIEEITLQLPHAGACEIVMRNGPRDPAALFKCEAFVPPQIDDGPLLIIRHPVLTAVFRPDGLNFETVGNFRDGQHSLEDWRLSLRGLAYMASGSGSVSLEFGGVRLPPVVVPHGSLNGPYVEELPRLLAFVDRWWECLSLAGTSPVQDFSLRDIWDAQSVQIGLDMLFNPEPKARLEFDVIEGVEHEQEVDALYFNAFTFAGSSIAFAVKVTLERNDMNGDGFSSTRFKLLDIRPGVSDLKAYGAELAEQSKLSVIIDPDNIVMQTLDSPVVVSDREATPLQT